MFSAQLFSALFSSVLSRNHCLHLLQMTIAGKIVFIFIYSIGFLFSGFLVFLFFHGGLVYNRNSWRFIPIHLQQITMNRQSERRSRSYSSFSQHQQHPPHHHHHHHQTGSEKLKKIVFLVVNGDERLWNY